MGESDQVKSRNERRERAEVSCRLFAAQGNVLETLKFSDCDFDARSGLAEDFWEVRGLDYRVGFVRNDRRDAAFAAQSAVGRAVIVLVADGGARFDVGTKIKQNLKVRAVAHLAAGQVKGDGMAVHLGSQMDFGGEAAARPSASSR